MADGILTPCNVARSLFHVYRHSATVLIAYAFQGPPSGTHSHKTYEAVTFPGNSSSVDLRHGCLSVLMCRWRVWEFVIEDALYKFTFWFDFFDHDNDFARWLHPATWHAALESWQWIHQVAAPCNVTCSSEIMTLNSPGGSTLQCGKWLWDDMPLNSPKRPPYWNSTSGFDFDHITAVNMSFCTSLRNFIQIGPPSAEKNDVMSIFKLADLSHLGF